MPSHGRRSYPTKPFRCRSCADFTAALSLRPPRVAAQPRCSSSFSSVKLAVVLLAVIIVASIAGTLYETSFDAKVARAYIYNAWWFDTWLTLLCVNLACAAFSRMPWKRHHTGFLLTHLGIITLLIGAMIGRGWGIEGTMTIFKGQPPNNQLVVDQRVLRVEEGGSSAQYPVNIIGRHPDARRRRGARTHARGLERRTRRLRAAHRRQLSSRRPSRPNAGGQPAVRIKLVSKRLKQTMDNWLMANDAEHATLDLGLASVQVRRGVAPTAAPAATRQCHAVPPGPTRPRRPPRRRTRWTNRSSPSRSSRTIRSASPRRAARPRGRRSG